MEQLLKLKIIAGIVFLSLFAFCLAASPSESKATLPPIETAGYYKQLKIVSDKIAANPKAYKKDRPKGSAWAKKNLSEGLTNLKKTIWKRYDQRLVDNAIFEKVVYDRLVYNEAIRHALSMEGLKPLTAKAESLINKITFHQSIKCKPKWNKKLAKKNKKLAWKKYRKAKKKCEKKVRKKIYSLRNSLKVVNNELEPAKQQKLNEHILKTAGINAQMATIKTNTRNLANNATVQELHKATSASNRGRNYIGLSILSLPNPKLASVSSAQSEFWGMMTGSAIDWQKAAQAGVGTVRLNMYYGTITVNPKKYDWKTQDAAFIPAAKAGIRIIPTFYGYKKTGGPNLFRFGSSDWNVYTKFIKETVKRYGPGGTLWKENPGIPYMPVISYGVWNEPNFLFNNNHQKRVDVENYAQVLVGMSRSIKKIDPSAIVSVGGLANAQNSTKLEGVSGANFLTRLYNYPEVRSSFDAVSFHPYSSTVKGMADSIEEIRGIMNSNGDTNKPLYITEVGWATGGRTGGLVVSPAEQAANLTQAMNWFKANRARLRIPVVAWYFWKDVPKDAIYGGQNMWYHNAGLLDINGAPKPAWYAFLAATGGN